MKNLRDKEESKNIRNLSPSRTMELSPRSEALAQIDSSVLYNKFKAFCDSSDSMAGMLNVKLIR